VIHVPSNRVADHWDRVRAGLDRIIRKTAPDWSAGDVLCALARGDAFLALIEDDAFLIWQRYPGDDGRGMLFILACEGRGLALHGPAVYAELETMARNLRCARVRMMSPRKGWASEPFWTLTGYVFEHEVEP
jgi:hypothetical protein